ncbi:uncharacterized protein LOC6606997 [Drosophila sechellia]|uniref:GM23858 n=1 Tax=Drosophila sechellia TaxID=7238 RepID=B4HJA0_DROSE|nr:uncharacterized protein LOC6606997 [Drosophila sechellia]EDW42772.1 GM23858 [Drosophila sechellia]
MNFVRLSIFFPLFYIVNGNATNHKSLWDDDEENEAQKPILRIHHINIFGDSRYMKALSYIDETRLKFTLVVSLREELGSNFLTFNIKIRVRPTGRANFVTLLQMRDLDLCGFFAEFRKNPMMKYILQSEMQLSDIIACPVRVGNYSLKNVSVKGIYPQVLQNGIYKFFVEVIEATAEKVFALQVTTEVRIPNTAK